VRNATGNGSVRNYQPDFDRVIIVGTPRSEQVQRFCVRSVVAVDKSPNTRQVIVDHGFGRAVPGLVRDFLSSKTIALTDVLSSLTNLLRCKTISNQKKHGR
jgi:hypothetical protein